MFWRKKQDSQIEEIMQRNLPREFHGNKFLEKSESFEEQKIENDVLFKLNIEEKKTKDKDIVMSTKEKDKVNQDREFFWWFWGVHLGFPLVFVFLIATNNWFFISLALFLVFVVFVVGPIFGSRRSRGEGTNDSGWNDSN